MSNPGDYPLQEYDVRFGMDKIDGRDLVPWLSLFESERSSGCERPVLLSPMCESLASVSVAVLT